MKSGFQFTFFSAGIAYHLQYILSLNTLLKVPIAKKKNNTKRLRSPYDAISKTM